MTDHRTAWRWAAGGFALGASLVVIVAATDEPRRDDASGTADTVTVSAAVDPDHPGDAYPVSSGDPGRSPRAFARVVEGERLHVQGERFVPTEEVYVMACIRLDDGRHCQVPTATHTTADDAGDIDLTFTPGPFPGFTDIGDCRAHRCWVRVSGTAAPGDAEAVRARFALDP